MLSKPRRFISAMTHYQRFMLASLLILISGMVAIGWWVGMQIETGVIRRTAATVALYVNSFVSPQLQIAAGTTELSADENRELKWLLTETDFGKQIVAFKVWGKGGRILYSTEASTIGQTFPVDDDLRQAWQGDVSSNISDLDDEENESLRGQFSSLLQTYMPVRLRGTNDVVAVAEYYQTVTDLNNEINDARMKSWMVVGVATLIMYALLAGFVRRASNTISGQQGELNKQVVRLTELLEQNQDLSERVRRAAGRTTALNERFLRRVSADLHDGPAQDLSLAILRLDRVIQTNEEATPDNKHDEVHESAELEAIQVSLQHAMQEVREISAGLVLPELGQLSVDETISKAVRAHERRTNTKVSVLRHDLPAEASLPVKISLYRLIQEALNNAYQHAGGAGQQVQVTYRNGDLDVEIADSGPGFAGEPTTNSESDGNKHLGLAGMRERVESLGGLVRIESALGKGTKVFASIPLQINDKQEEFAL